MYQEISKRIDVISYTLKHETILYDNLKRVDS